MSSRAKERFAHVTSHVLMHTIGTPGTSEDTRFRSPVTAAPERITQN
jgi:hypothetical protein